MRQRWSFWVAMLLCISLLMSGCQERSHECKFHMEQIEDRYLCAPATCVSAATYFYSCSCGAVGESLFSSGEPLPHDSSAKNATAKYLKTAATCQSGAEYYDSCSVCGRKAETTFFSELLGVCVYTSSAPLAQYLKAEATETSAAIYYKSCAVCGAAGEDTFAWGDPLPPSGEGGDSSNDSNPEPQPPVEGGEEVGDGSWSDWESGEDITELEPTPKPGEAPHAATPKQLTCELVDFRSDMYEFTWITEKKPRHASLRIWKGSSTEGKFKQYAATVKSNYNGTYQMSVTLALEPSHPYVYLACDAVLGLVSEAQGVTTSDTEAMAQFYLMGTTSDVNMFGAVVLTKNKTIVIDGGRTNADGTQLAQFLSESAASHVDAWFFTHPHSDHVSAFYYVVTQHPSIQIDNVYYNVPALEDIAAYGRGGTEADMWKNVLNLLDQERFDGRVHTLQTGEVFTFDEVRLKVLRVYNPELTTGDFANEASAVFRIENDRSSFLILGDIGPGAAAEVMEDCLFEDLCTEYVQMAHHGQGGASKEFYEYIQVQKCIWPTNVSLWNNDNGGGYNSGPWSTIKTRDQMAALGVTEHYVAKDGIQCIDF